MEYSIDYVIKVWKNDLVIDVIRLSNRSKVDQWKKDHPEIKLKYEINNKITYTLEQ